MSGYEEVDARLNDLAEHLDYDLASRLLALIKADALAHQVIDLQQRTQLAEDLANECKRQLRSAHRQIDRLRAEAGS